MRIYVLFSRIMISGSILFYFIFIYVEAHFVDIMLLYGSSDDTKHNYTEIILNHLWKMFLQT